MIWADLNSRQPNTTNCTKGLESKRGQLVAEEAPAGIDRCFRAYVRMVTNVADFKCFGHILMAMDDYWLAVVANL